jgi:lipid A 3-O-deacylase
MLQNPNKKSLVVAVLLALSGASAAHSQAGPEKGAHEFELWTGGGPGTSGGVSGTGVWNAGARYGWVLTGPHGPGLLRGRFEYAVDAAPVFVVFQPGGTAYGVSFDPFAFKWNFDTRGRIVPYAEMSGGVLFTNRQVPAGMSRINFTPSVAGGIHLLRSKWNWSVELRYMHISDAGLTTLNSGINTIQVRVGFGLFTHGREKSNRRNSP